MHKDPSNPRRTPPDPAPPRRSSPSRLTPPAPAIELPRVRCLPRQDACACSLPRLPLLAPPPYPLGSSLRKGSMCSASVLLALLALLLGRLGRPLVLLLALLLDGRWRRRRRGARPHGGKRRLSVHPDVPEDVSGE